MARAVGESLALKTAPRGFGHCGRRRRRRRRFGDRRLLDYNVVIQAKKVDIGLGVAQIKVDDKIVIGDEQRVVVKDEAEVVVGQRRAIQERLDLHWSDLVRQQQQDHSLMRIVQLQGLRVEPFFNRHFQLPPRERVVLVGSEQRVHVAARLLEHDVQRAEPEPPVFAHLLFWYICRRRHGHLLTLPILKPSGRSLAAMDSLKAMFEGQGWDDDTLREILKCNNDDPELAVDAILAAGSPAGWAAQRSVTPDDSVDVAVPAGAGATMNVTTNDGRSVTVDVPTGLNEGDHFRAQVPPPRTGRGTPVQLPDDFLRVPGVQTDEQLAMMLQQEAFYSEQRRRDPQRRPRPPQRASSSSSSSMSSMLASVGTSMRAGLASASTRIQSATARLSKKDSSQPEQPPSYASLVDHQDDFRDDGPGLIDSRSAAPAPAAPAPAAPATHHYEEDEFTETIAL